MKKRANWSLITALIGLLAANQTWSVDRLPVNKVSTYQEIGVDTDAIWTFGRPDVPSPVVSAMTYEQDNLYLYPQGHTADDIARDIYYVEVYQPAPLVFSSMPTTAVSPSGQPGEYTRQGAFNGDSVFYKEHRERIYYNGTEWEEILNYKGRCPDGFVGMFMEKTENTPAPTHTTITVDWSWSSKFFARPPKIGPVWTGMEWPDKVTTHFCSRLEMWCDARGFGPVHTTDQNGNPVDVSRGNLFLVVKLTPDDSTYRYFRFPLKWGMVNIVDLGGLMRSLPVGSSFSLIYKEVNDGILPQPPENPL